MFAKVTIGIQGQPFGFNEVQTIRDHLFQELDALLALEQLAKYEFQSIDIGISNLVFANEFIDMVMPGSSQTGHKKNDFEQAFKHFSGNSSSKNNHLNIDENLLDILKSLGLKKGLKILEMFIDTLRPIAEEYAQKYNIHFHFDLSRSAGINYYRHICYSIVGINHQGEKISLGDGGSTNWATKLSDNKQLFTVSSGIGTEILIRNFKKPAI